MPLLAGKSPSVVQVFKADRINASFVVSPGPKGSNIYLDPFWIHSENPAFRSGGQTGLDTRDTYGARLWGRRGQLRFDWTLARQTGDHMNREVEAWGLFSLQSMALSDKGWSPRLVPYRPRLRRRCLRNRNPEGI